MPGRRRRRIPIIGGLLVSSWLAGGIALAAADVELQTIQQLLQGGGYDEALHRTQRWLGFRPEDPDRQQAVLAIGRQLVELGRLPDAQGLFQSLLDHPPSRAVHDAALLWLGELARKQGQRPQARVQYQRLLQEFPASPFAAQARYALALSWYEEGQFEPALAGFRSVANSAVPAAQRIISGTAAGESGSLRREAELMAGVALYRLQRYTDALPVLQGLLVSSVEQPIRAAASYYVAEVEYYTGRTVDAIAHYHHAQYLAPNSQIATLAQYGLGWALYQAQQYDESSAAFETFLRGITPSQLQDSARYALGMAQRAGGHRVAALATFDQVLHVTPNGAWAVPAALAKGELLVEEHQVAEAIRWYHELQGRYGTSDQLGCHLAQAYAEAGEVTEALQQFHDVAEHSRDPSLQAQALLATARLQAARGRYDEALAAYLRVQQQLPAGAWQGEAGLARVQLLMHLERPAEALKAAQQLSAGAAAADDEVQRQALLWQGQLLTSLHRLDDALQVYTVLLERFPDAAEAGETALWCAATLIRQEQWPQAQSLLQRIVTRQPPAPASAEARFWLGWIAERRQQSSEARQAYELLVREAPQSPWALAARLRLAAVLTDQGLLDQAIQQLGTTHHRRAFKLAGDLLRQASRPREAIDWYARAIPLPPPDAAEAAWPTDTGDVSDASLQFAIASAYEEDRQLDAAIRAYLALAQAPAAGDQWIMKAQLACAKLYEDTERYAEARALYASIARSPAEEAKYAQERLDWLNAQPQRQPR